MKRETKRWYSKGGRKRDETKERSKENFQARRKTGKQSDFGYYVTCLEKKRKKNKSGFDFVVIHRGNRLSFLVHILRA